MTDMFCLVSQPGPVETSILSELSPILDARRRPMTHVTLRCLWTKQQNEGTSTDPSPFIRGDKPPVVLLHGRGHAATIWLPLLPDVARRGPVLAVDLPGFGHSSSVPFQSGGPLDGLRFFTDPIEELLLKHRLKDPVIVGHSLGGLVAVELALRGAVQPSKLVLIGGMGLGPSMTHASRAFFRAGPERLARLGGPGLMNLISPYPKTPLGRRLAALEHELYTVRGGRPAPSAAFNTLFPRLGSAFHRLERLGEIRCPTMLLWGDKDAVFPPSVASDAAAAIRDATLRIEPLGHAPHIEAPERIVPLLLDFLG